MVPRKLSTLPSRSWWKVAYLHSDVIHTVQYHDRGVFYIEYPRYLSCGRYVDFRDVLPLLIECPGDGLVIKCLLESQGALHTLGVEVLVYLDRTCRALSERTIA